jgi:hypothetical protein
MTTLTATPVIRQRLLVLYLSDCSLESEVVAWARYDGASERDFDGTREDNPPYASVLAAMRDGWRVIKFPEMPAATTDTAYQTSVLPNEFVLEQLVEVTRA